LTANAEKDGEVKEIIEEEKKTAVPAKGRATKGAKSTKKKAVSE
jgi:hypothetical protein